MKGQYALMAVAVLAALIMMAPTASSSAEGTHTVTFCDADGSVISTQYVEHGGRATAPQLPDNGLMFTGWSEDYTYVVRDMTVYATYNTEIWSDSPFDPNYTVTLTSTPYGIAPFSNKTVTSGTTWSASGSNLLFSNGYSPVTAPSVSGYTFVQWQDANGNTSGTIKNNITLYAKYSSNYTVTGSGTQSDPYTYVNVTAEHAGTALRNKYVAVGSSITISENTDGKYDWAAVSVTPNHGLTISSDNLTGTLTGNSGDTVTIEVDQWGAEGVGEDKISFTIVGGSSSTNYTITFTNSPSAGGSTTYSSLSVPSGTTFWIGNNDNQIRFSYNSTLVTASAASGYKFS
ncbi:MAG: hypothetical protein IJT54_02650, partial [Candidatus Methanomethylophilaceae archaeon]|nr:hypothetical protein [Candidatus Methanomethylophilaceae archaeon]